MSCDGHGVTSGVGRYGGDARLVFTKQQMRGDAHGNPKKGNHQPYCNDIRDIPGQDVFASFRHLFRLRSKPVVRPYATSRRCVNTNPSCYRIETLL